MRMPPWEAIAMVIGMIGFLTYLFIFRRKKYDPVIFTDKPRKHGESNTIWIFVFLTVAYIFSTGCFYVTFALWHKYLGPYFQ